MERNGISFFHVLNQDNRKLCQCLGAYRDIFMRQMTINMFCTDAGVAPGRTCRPRHERGARRKSSGKDSLSWAYRSDGPRRHNMSYIPMISKVVFEDTKI